MRLSAEQAGRVCDDGGHDQLAVAILARDPVGAQLAPDVYLTAARALVEAR